MRPEVTAKYLELVRIAETRPDADREKLLSLAEMMACLSDKGQAFWDLVCECKNQIPDNDPIWNLESLDPEAAKRARLVNAMFYLIESMGNSLIEANQTAPSRVPMN